MKKILTIILCLFLVFGFLSFNYQEASQERDITININGIQKSFNQQPVIINGLTIVPVRAISEALGATVSWEKSTQMVTVVKDDITISLQIGNAFAYVNQQEYFLSTSTQLSNDTAMVPLRFVSEALGANVEWDSETYTIDITTDEVDAAIPDKLEQTEASNTAKEFESFQIFYLFDENKNTITHMTEDEFVNKFDKMSEIDLNKEYVAFEQFEDGSYEALIYKLCLNDSTYKLLFAQTWGSIVDNQYVGECLLNVMAPPHNGQIGYESTYNYTYEKPILENEKQLNFSPHIPSE